MIFTDLDGPILDVSDRYYTIYSDLVSGAGFKPIPKADYWSRKRAKVSEKNILSESGAAEYFETYARIRINRLEQKTYLSRDTLQMNAKSGLDRLRKFGVSLVTLRAERANLESQLVDLGISDCFDEVLSAPAEGDGWTIKARLIREFCGGTRKPLAILGDTEGDLLAGKDLGILTIGVASGIRSLELLAACQPSLIIEGIWEIDRVLAALKGLPIARR